MNMNDHLLNTLIKKLSVCLFWKNRDGVYLGCNDSFAKHVGIDSTDAIIGKTDFDLPVEKHSSEHYRRMDERIIATQQEHNNIEETQVTETGEIRHLLTSKVPIVDDNNNSIGILGIYNDITSIKQAEEIAEKANRAKSQFLMNISHDFRTPFSGILGMSQLLLDKEHDKEKQSMLNDIITSSKQLLNLLNDIIDLTRNEQHEIRVKPELIDLDNVLQETLKLYQAEISQKSLSVNVVISEKLPKKITTDKTIISRILLNLICNAVKYTEQGEITVQCNLTHQNELEIHVIDTGLGIESSDLNTIFDPFHRTATSPNQLNYGPGLGLSLVKQLVTTLNGSISVSSKMHHGSCFTLVLPIDHVNEAVPSKITDHHSLKQILNQVASPNPRVLVVEDDPISQRYADMLLTSHQCDVTTTSNAEQALSLDHHKFDIVLIDIGLPDIPGDQLIETLRQNIPSGQPQPLYVAVTAHLDQRKKLDYQSKRFDYVLQKPLDI